MRILARASKALLGLLFVAALCGPTVADAQESGTITGTAYFDRDADGTRDGGEEALATTVRVFGDVAEPVGDPIATAQTNDSGAFSLSLPPGTYRLDSGVQRHAAICADTIGPSNAPFSGSKCWGAALPITSPLLSEPVEVEAGQQSSLDLAITVRDQHLFIVRAIVETEYAPAGGIVEAVAGETVCGSGTVPAQHPDSPPGDNNFNIYVDGAGSVAGCAEPGDTVTFRLLGHGLIAGQTYEYVPFVPREIAPLFPVTRITHADLVFAEDYMWLWSDNLVFPDGSRVPDRARVIARIGQAGCGLGINVAELAPGGSVGFGQIAVPSERISIGCGEQGAIVQLVAILPEGDRVITSFPWAPGVTQVGGGAEFAPIPEETPAPVPTVFNGTPVGVRGPDAGQGAASSDDSQSWFVLTALIAGVVMIALAMMRRYGRPL
jgi:hypothetical protein